MSIALLGWGTVAKGTAKALEAGGYGVEKVLVRRDIPELKGKAVWDFKEISEDPEVTLVAELMGGREPAFSYVKAALEAGKDVVSANKLMIAEHFKELTEITEKTAGVLSFSAAAGGGIPWLTNLLRISLFDEVLSVSGIMNGSSNYILDKMETEGESFEKALSKAQELGYAEADPSFDIDGGDLASKLALSCNIAWKGMLRPRDIPVLGIRYIKKRDIDYFKEQGLVCRLIGKGEKRGGLVFSYVEPVLFKKGSFEASVRGTGNLISVESVLAGKRIFGGRGAGGGPTGCAVAMDISDVLQKRSIFRFVSCLGEFEIASSNVPKKYYVRRGSKEPERITIAPSELYKEVKEELSRGVEVFAASFDE